MGLSSLEILTSKMVADLLKRGLGSSVKILKFIGEDDVVRVTGHLKHKDATEFAGKTYRDVGLPGAISPDPYSENRRGFQGIMLTRAGSSFEVRPPFIESEQDLVVDLLAQIMKSLGKNPTIKIDSVVL